MDTETMITPEEDLQRLQARRTSLQERLVALEAMVPDAEEAHSRAVAYSDDEIEHSACRDTLVELQTDIRAVDSALSLIERDITAASAVVEQREAQRLIHVAEEAGERVKELSAPIKALVEDFARQWAPLVAAARQARAEHSEAYYAALLAQKMPLHERNELFRKSFGDGIFFSASGDYALERELDRIADGLPSRKQEPESFHDATPASELVSTDESPRWGHPEHPEEAVDIFTRPAAIPA
jgi:predicted  nucleic acid-binding Zn-ribbon protein